LFPLVLKRNMIIRVQDITTNTLRFIRLYKYDYNIIIVIIILYIKYYYNRQRKPVAEVENYSAATETTASLAHGSNT